MPRPTAHPDRPAGKRGASGPAKLHPRNRHQGRYDFERLTAASPPLSAFLTATPDGGRSIDFSQPAAVRALNRALLKADYGIAHWDLPEDYLCPPIPGRADYLHGLADLLAADNDGSIPRGGAVHALDIGTGANVIYPLLGHSEYGWRFVGTDIDAVALRSAEAIVRSNRLEKAIALRHQRDRANIFEGLFGDDECFDLTLCNPPFHASAEAATEGTRRKWRNLGRAQAGGAGARLNFGGQSSELWCAGGEAGFARRMIRESMAFSSRVLWFSCLIAKSAHLADIRRQLHQAGARDMREIAMAQGSKQSRFVAWTFMDTTQRDAWRHARWRRGP